MKKFLALALALVMLFSLAACGKATVGTEGMPGLDDYDTHPDGPGGMEEAVDFDFSGCWVCDGMRAGDTEMDSDQLLSMFGVSPDELLSVEIMGDNAIVSLMGQGFRAGCTDSEYDEAVILSADPGMLGEGVEGFDITLTLEDDGRLSCSQQLGTLLLSRVDARPEALARQLSLYFLPDYTPEESAALANFGAEGMYVIDGDTIYGRLAQLSFLKSCLASATLSMDIDNVWPKLSSPKVLLPTTTAKYLNLIDGQLYFLCVNNAADNARSICRINTDGSGLETLIEDAEDYMQIVGGRIYYCNSDYRYCSADLDGNDVNVLFDKEVYCCAQVKPGLLMYQDDADNESLHLRDLDTGADIRIAMGRVYGYGITGNTLFFTKIDDDTYIQAKNHICRLYRMDLTKPIPQYSENGELLFAFAYEVGDNNMGDGISVLSDMLYSNNRGQAELDNWKSLSDDSYFYIGYELKYCDDDWYIFQTTNSNDRISGFDFYNAQTGHCTTYLNTEDIQ